MPIVTNVHGLPEALVRAVANDPYSNGGADISVTTLIDAPQIRRLKKRHADAITVDVSERIWTLLGQAVHTILERAALQSEGMVAETRLFATVKGWTLSGQFDVMALETGVLSDYKVTSTAKVTDLDKWTQQLNILRWLAHQNGEAVKSLEIIASSPTVEETGLKEASMAFVIVYSGFEADSVVPLGEMTRVVDPCPTRAAHMVSISEVAPDPP